MGFSSGQEWGSRATVTGPRITWAGEDETGVGRGEADMVERRAT